MNDEQGVEGSGRAATGGSPGRQDLYRELFEHSADAILIIEGETFIDCNEATVRMLRYGTRQELLRTHPSELSPPKQPDGRDSFEKANEMIAIAFERGSHRFEWDHVRADGEVFPVEVLLTALQEEGRRVLHVVWRDITERRRLEGELRQAQKMEAIGKLAGGIAHDFNNLLVAILGNSDLLRDIVGGDRNVVPYLDEIEHAADRASDLVKQLLAFSRKQEVMPRVIDVAELIAGIQALLGRLIGEDVRLETELADEDLKVEADRGQLEQVLLNLATNARDAMPGGGVLTIRTESLTLSAPLDSRGEKLPPGAYVAIEVGDTGIGMPAPIADRAFDPFFTTKEQGQGTGLGLATVYGITRQAGGTVLLDSVEGQGTRVRLLLPRSEAEASAASPGRVELPVEGGTETILLAEDESAVSTLVGRALCSKGYRVVHVHDGRQALETYFARQSEFDLIVTDVIMPEMGGAEMAVALREAGHTPPILFVSGYTDDALVRLRSVGGDVDLLEKPFHAEELVGRVRLALDRARKSGT